MNDALPALQGITERMIVRKEGPLGWIVFNQPPRHNAMSVDMWESLPKILDAYEADPEIRVIIITGAGDKAFVSGADISQFGERRGTMEAVKEYNAIADHANDRLQACGKPVLAMIRGFCVGEQTGELDAELKRLAAEYQADGLARLDALAEWLPRLLYIAVVIYVGYGVVTFYKSYLDQAMSLLDGN